MIHGVFGKLGAGKGLHVMEIIVHELLNGFRDVVTNVPLRFVPWVNGQGIPQIGLHSYIITRIKCSEEVADEYVKRVKIVEEVDDLWDMFLWRRDGETGEWFKMTPTHADEKGRPDRFDPNEAKDRNANACLVVTDEAWICYPNNGGWSRSPLIPFYGRQQRKLRDEWYIVTQHPTDVDSVIWNITQDFTVCRNHGMERMGMFRQPAMFRTITYLTNPAKGNAVRSHENYKRLDVKGLAQCYDTTAGVGFTGGFKGDANQKRSGLHIGWLLAAVVALVAVLACVPHLLGKGAASWIGHTMEKPKNPAAWAGLKTNNLVRNRPLAFRPGGLALRSDGLASQPADLAPRSDGMASSPGSMAPDFLPPVEMAGYSEANGKFTVMLTDGEIFKSGDGQLTHLEKTFCIIGTNRFRLHVDDPRLKPAQPAFVSDSSPLPAARFAAASTQRPVFPSVQVIPFGNRNQPTQLPMQNDEGLAGFDSGPARR